MSSPAVVSDVKPKAKRGPKKSDDVVVDIVPPPVPIDVKPKKTRAPPKKKDDDLVLEVPTTEQKPKKKAPVKNKSDDLVVDDLPNKKTSAKNKSDNVDSDVTADEKIKKVRAPTLPAKFAKFIQFGFWFMKKVNSDGATLLNIDEDIFLQQIHLFDQVQLQQAFVQEFFDQSKDNLKTIRSIIKDRSKAAIKAAKANAPKKPRASRPKNNNNDPLVNQLVSLATQHNHLNNSSLI